MESNLEEKLHQFTARVSKSLTEKAHHKRDGCRPYMPHVQPEQPTCPDCKEPWDSASKGWLRCPKCESKKCLQRFSRLCPTEYARTDESRLPQVQWGRVKAWVPGDRSLLLLGPTGTCKTRSAWMLIKRLSEQRFKVKPFSPIGFGTQLVDAQMKGDGMKFLNEVINAQLVFFDDLGKGKLTENVEACLFEVIELRTSWHRATIATTNDTGETLQGRMSGNRGEPFVRRLRSFFEVIEFKKGETQ